MCHSWGSSHVVLWRRIKVADNGSEASEFIYSEWKWTEVRTKLSENLNFVKLENKPEIVQTRENVTESVEQRDTELHRQTVMLWQEFVHQGATVVWKWRHTHWHMPQFRIIKKWLWGQHSVRGSLVLGYHIPHRPSELWKELYRVPQLCGGVPSSELSGLCVCVCVIWKAVSMGSLGPFEGVSVFRLSNLA